MPALLVGCLLARGPSHDLESWSLEHVFFLSWQFAWTPKVCKITAFFAYLQWLRAICLAYFGGPGIPEKSKIG